MPGLMRRRHRHHGGGGGGGGAAQKIAFAGLTTAGQGGFGYTLSGNLGFSEATAHVGKGTVKKSMQIGGGGTLFTLYTNGDMWASGGNGTGAMCIGTFIKKRIAPVKMLLTNVEDFEASGSGGIAKLKDGTIQTWGSNPWGQIGNGESLEGGSGEGARLFAKSTPYTVTFPGRLASEVTHIYADNSNCAVIFNDGAVMTWGENNQGQIGDGTEKVTRPSPTLIWTPTSEGTKAVELALGCKRESNSHMIMRRKDGRLMGWGCKRQGQLGLEPFNATNVLTPTLIPEQPGTTNVIKLSAGSEITLPINASGELFVFGTGKEYCHGLGPGVAPSTVIWPPQKVRAEVTAAHTEQHTLGVITAAGKLFTCGNNKKHQTGLVGVTEVEEMVQSLTEVANVHGVTSVKVSIYGIVILCESCPPQAQFTLKAKKRAVATSFVSSTNSKWKVIIKKLVEAGGDEGEEEEEGEEGEEEERHQRHLFLGTTTASGLGLIGGTFSQAWGKTTPYPGAPAVSPSTSDSTAGHRSEAKLDFTVNASGIAAAKELEEGAIVARSVVRFYGTPNSAKPKVGLKWIAGGTQERDIGAGAGETPLEGATPEWHKRKLSKGDDKALTASVLKAATMYGETGVSSSWAGTSAYFDVWLEWPQEEIGIAEAARSCLISTYKGVPLEPGVRYSVRIGKGPAGWETPESEFTAQGVRAPENQANLKGDTGTLQIQAWGALLTGAYVVTGLPTGATVDKDSGLISFNLSKAGTYTVKVTVAGIDEELEAWTDTVTFTWTVT